MKRIALAGIAIECCTFSPVPTRLDDLTIWYGDDLLALYPSLKHYPDVTFVPIMRVRATPGGPLIREVYAALKAELLAALSQGAPWDGVYLDLHGALAVDGMTDAEADLTGAVRAAVGAEVLISASFDLHGNLSADVAANLDILTAFRTAPHVDVQETHARALALLVDALRTGMRPVIAHAPIPMLLPGEMAVTTAEPTHSLYAALPGVIAQYGLIDASYFVGYVWADEARVGACAVAVGCDRASAQAAAETLAHAWWGARDQFAFGMPTADVDSAIRMAIAAQRDGAPVFLSDAGDNITGGGVGDVPLVLDRLIVHGVTNAIYAAIVDADAVHACIDAGVGARLTLTIGGRLDTAHGKPLPIVGTVRHVQDGEPRQRHAVIDVQGIAVILTARRTAFIETAQFTALGLSPETTPIIVVKLGYLFPDLQRIARTTILMFSPGAINPDVRALPYRAIRSGMWMP
jgi:microcystin degradation protein MlrC